MTASTASSSSPSPSNQPRLAAFPKAFMQPLCKDGGMSVSDWIALAAPLGVEGLEWYAGFLEMADVANWPRHGEIGKGLNDYDAIFSELKGKGFCGWISIEDGVEGMDQLARSVAFLKRKIAEHWPA